MTFDDLCEKLRLKGWDVHLYSLHIAGGYAVEVRAPTNGGGMARNTGSTPTAALNNLVKKEWPSGRIDALLTPLDLAWRGLAAAIEENRLSRITP